MRVKNAKVESSLDTSKFSSIFLQNSFIVKRSDQHETSGSFVEKIVDVIRKFIKNPHDKLAIMVALIFQVLLE